MFKIEVGDFEREHLVAAEAGVHCDDDRRFQMLAKIDALPYQRRLLAECRKALAFGLPLAIDQLLLRSHPEGILF